MPLTRLSLGNTVAVTVGCILLAIFGLLSLQALPRRLILDFSDLFEEGQGMVGTGRYVGGTFEASEILAKHDETYMPKEVSDALKEQGVYREPES